MASLGSPTLDCFRNGSIIQLKSKITDKTLLLHQGGNVSGKRNRGFYAEYLSRGTPVWGRWVDRTYHPGRISDIGTQVHIKFNDGDTITHDGQDLTAVVADDNPGYLGNGTRVIAQWKNKARYYPGRVVGEAYSSYNIQFDDGDRGWARRDQIRVFSQNAPSAGYLWPTTPIWGRWVDRTWHRGRISKFVTQVHIKFDDGDTISHDVHDQNAAVADVNPSPDDVRIGSRVIAQWRNKARYYPGRVVGEAHSSYDIQFDDGDRGWADLTRIRLLPPIATPAGSRVYGLWKNSVYHPGVVERVDTKIHIKFNDGDRISHFPIDTDAVVRDVTPDRGTVVIGSRVIAFWPNQVRYYPGRVAYVNEQGSNPSYFVHYDDGDRGWAAEHQLRLMFEPNLNPANADHFIVKDMGQDMVALKSIAFPHLALSIDYGRVIGKTLDDFCRFHIHEEPDNYVSLESYKLPGQHISVDYEGTVSASTKKNDKAAFFKVKSEVKLLEKSKNPQQPEQLERYEKIFKKMEKAMDEFVGLTDVKEQFKKFAKTQILNDRRRQLGHRAKDETPKPLHLVFTGNPGTGKTSFARCVAELLCSIGKIKKNKVVEVQRSDLVGQFIGGTAKDTKKKIEEARGGVLFIDEAYRLIGEGKDYGKEAIEELMSEMEKGDPVMIFAGYEELMAKFLEVNMGMKSRITHKFVFPDHTIKELAVILRQRVEEEGFQLATDVNVESVIEKCTSKGQRATMNARLVRKLLHGSIEEASNRLPINAPESKLFEIKEIDIVKAASRLR